MIEYASVFIPVSVALGLSLVVERILELGSNVFDWLFKFRNLGKYMPGSYSDKSFHILTKNHELQKLRDEVEDRAELAVASGKLEVDLMRDTQLDESLGSASILVTNATDPDDGDTRKRFILDILGFAVGIFLARLYELQIFGPFLTGMSQSIAQSADYLLTGLIVGGGSRPMHFIIRMMTDRKVIADAIRSTTGCDGARTDLIESEQSREESVENTKALQSQSLVAAASGSDSGHAAWLDIPYDGGVDRNRLESTHLRKADPDLIVFHHTTMHRSSTFDDVVRVIKSRTDSQGNHWITGYNSVIMEDGSIRNFCRWDRYGNHASGYNRRSLGMAFNGNFEIRANIPFSNPDGRYGESRPSRAQLIAGARLAVLWTALYGIRTDFDHAIIPHKKLAHKSCPGSNFPYEEFFNLIDHYSNLLANSKAMQEQIKDYRLKPYLFV